MGREVENQGKEIQNLRERLKKLSAKKSRLQLVSDILTEFALVKGLKNMAQKAVFTIMDAIGGNNVILYYQVNQDWYYTDMSNPPQRVEQLDDPLVLEALSLRVHVESGDLKEAFDLTIKGFAGSTRAWVFPLLAGEDLIGALKLDGIFIDYTDEIKSELQLITNYIGLAMGNQIVSESKIKKAYDALKFESQKLENEVRERRNTEKALRTSEERFELAMEFSNDGLFDWNLKSKTVYYSPGWKKMLGYKDHEIKNEFSEWERLTQPKDVKASWEMLEKVLNKERDRFELEFKMLHKEGYWVDILSRANVIFNQKGEGERVVGTHVDITRRKQAEESLKTSHERFLTVLDSIDATIYVADMDSFEILFMNQYMIKLFGRDLTGKRCWQVLRGETGQCPNCTNDKLIDKNGSPIDAFSWQDENPVTGRYFANHDRAIEWTDGRIVRIQISTDITDFKRMEEQLQQAQKMESVGRLAGGVAHDFNNMLSIILGNTEIILEDIDQDDPIESNLKEIKKAGERSSNLTRQLLAFARKQTIEPKVLDLNDAIEGMLKMLRRLIGENIELSWSPKINLWPVKVDPSQIDQILANLCVNARDAIKDVGKVVIETDNFSIDESYCIDHPGFTPGNYVMLALSDTGCGMDIKTLENLYEPFFTTKGVGEGTGLGLATVYGITKQNNGFINVYSEVDKGTTFRLYFPKHVGKVLSTEKPAVKKIDQIGCETILLVEDEQGILKMTTMMLERLGYNVLSADSPIEAMEIAKSYPEKIDLLVTDVVMPGMNGRDLAKEMYQLFPNLKSLFMSGYTANVIAHHGVLDYGMQFIQKPFSRQDLATKVRKILDGTKN